MARNVNYTVAYAKPSAFPTKQKQEKLEKHMKAYRVESKKEIEEYILNIKRKTSKIDYMYNGQAIISVH